MEELLRIALHNYDTILVGAIVSGLAYFIKKRDKANDTLRDEEKTKREKLDNQILNALDNVKDKVTGVDHKLDLSNKDISTLVKGQDKQSETNKRIFNEMGNMREDISKLQTDVEHLKDEKVK